MILRYGPPFRRVILLVLVAAMPIFFLWGVTADPFNLPKLSLLITCVSVVVAIRLAEVAQGGGVPRVASVTWPALFLVVPMTAAWVASPLKEWALLGHYQRYEGLLPYVLLAATGVLLVDAFDNRHVMIAWAWCASATVAALYALLQAIGLDPWDQPIEIYVSSTVGHGNFLGGVLATALPLAMTMWVRRYRGARVAAAMTVVVATGVLISFSQGAWAAAVAGVAVTIGIIAKDRFRLAPALGAGVAVITAAVVLSSVLVAFVAPLSGVAGGTARARAHLWIGAARMGGDAPLFGHGPNVYALKGGLYRTPLDALAHGDILADGPHSVPMAMFANAGLFGLLGFVLVFVWVVRLGSKSAHLDPLGAGFIGAAVAYFLQSLVSFDELLVGFALWVAIAGIAGAAGNAAPVPQTRGRPPALAGALYLLAIGIGTIGVITSSRLLAADTKAAQAQKAFALGLPNEALKRMDQAISTWDQPAYRLDKADILGTIAIDRGASGRTALSQIRGVMEPLDSLPHPAAALEEGVSLHLWSVNDIAVQREALFHLERGLALDPYNPNTRVRVAEALSRLGNDSKAVETLSFLVPWMEKYSAFKEDTAPVWGVLAVLSHQLGEDEEAKEYLERTLNDARAVGDLDRCHVLIAREIVAKPRPPVSDRKLRFMCPEVSIVALGYDAGP